MTITARTADDIDAHIGVRLRAARKLANISQADAGEKVGVSFQQIQKYEKGVNRVTLGRLMHLAEAYGVNLEFFIDGAPGIRGNTEPQDDLIAKMMIVPYGIDLAYSFVAMKSNEDRLAISNMAARLR